VRNSIAHCAIRSRRPHREFTERIALQIHAALAPAGSVLADLAETAGIQKTLGRHDRRARAARASTTQDPARVSTSSSGASAGSTIPSAIFFSVTLELDDRFGHRSIGRRPCRAGARAGSAAARTATATRSRTATRSSSPSAAAACVEERKSHETWQSTSTHRSPDRGLGYSIRSASARSRCKPRPIHLPTAATARQSVPSGRAQPRDDGQIGGRATISRSDRCKARYRGVAREARHTWTPHDRARHPKLGEATARLLDYANPRATRLRGIKIPEDLPATALLPSADRCRLPIGACATFPIGVLALPRSPAAGQVSRRLAGACRRPAAHLPRCADIVPRRCAKASPASSNLYSMELSNATGAGS